ncbi:hypothetical protein [Ensifer aridi]|uniref:hypothetical protein n=1 Tax=Ensifer aridi TaxID=1708715 RepID=UPI000A0F867D|nr:hypothetical protein [Ensifer aridi]
MKITWPDSHGKEITGRIDAALWPIVSVLGIERAARVLLRFGGSYVYIPASGEMGRNRLSRFVTSEEARGLIAAGIGPGSYRLPLGNQFLARYLRSRGRNVNEICRLIRSSDVSVRDLLKPDEIRRALSVKRKELLYGGGLPESSDFEADLKAAERVSGLPRPVTADRRPARAGGENG